MRRWRTWLWRWLGGGARQGAQAAQDLPPPAASDQRADEAPGQLDAEPAAVTAVTGDELDLHTFAPREVAEVVTEYVRWAAETGVARVRIIHGKGKGTLRRLVHATLARDPHVLEYGLCDERSGSWGATWARLAAAPSGAAEKRGIVAP